MTKINLLKKKSLAADDEKITQLAFVKLQNIQPVSFAFVKPTF